MGTVQSTPLNTEQSHKEKHFKINSDKVKLS